MTSYRHIFHVISYLQYPFYLGGIILFIISIIRIIGIVNNPTGDYTNDQVLEIGIHYWNMALFLLGLGISFSTLQDTTKTQNNFSLKVWQNPKKAKSTLIMMTILALFFITLGLLGMLVYQETIMGKLSYGFLAFGIAYICVVRTAIDMFEHHRLDKVKPV